MAEGKTFITPSQQCLPICRLSATVVSYCQEVASMPLCEVVVAQKLLGFSIGGPTDERHPFTKIRETSLG